MDDDQALAEISEKNKRQRRRPHIGIDGIIKKYMKDMPHRRRGYQAVDVFNELLPTELSAACRIDSVISGVLRVRVLSGPYLFQMKQLCPELLKELKKQCPSAGIKYIKLVADKRDTRD